MSDAPRLVDAHHHLWRRVPGSHPWLAGNPALDRDVTPATYDAAFAGFDIAATVWIEALAADPLAELAAAEEMRKASGGRVGAALIGHQPLDAPDFGERLDRCRAISPAFRGIRDIVAAGPEGPSLARSADLLDRPAFLDGLRELARQGLVFDLMLRPRQMARAARVLSQVPDLRVAIEHVASPNDRSVDNISAWHEGLAALAELPGTVMKVSALQCLEPGWTDDSLAGILAPVTAAFGAQRMCFGTDFPVHDQTCPGPEAIRAMDRITRDWTKPDRASLFEGTARELYSL
ncbi:amidohydrolase family protein [Roseisalinus antarcticus]|uniref:Amidohydrolase n=1 Tax=Roseisalinus antarcticus TaxID=254357 RepID=A0A1Y5SK73_9RHOB|nr:amidohydrolase family protein [Roseisalinus antarcticus]SLN42353.1 Amidohydrolase [Roseisalinus antarcticus]